MHLLGAFSTKIKAFTQTFAEHSSEPIPVKKNHKIK
jgi:hypothetical protein